MMSRTMVCMAVVLTAGLIHAEDYTYTWTAGEYPAKTSDGRVAFTYNSSKQISTLTANTDGGRIVFTGDAMVFASSGNAKIFNSSIGEIEFQNVVTANELRVISTYKDNTYTFGGTADSFLQLTNRVVMSNARLSDWYTMQTEMVKPSGVSWASANTFINGRVKRTDDKINLQFKTLYIKDGDYGYSKCVKLELSQSGNDIVARAFSPTYYSKAKYSSIGDSIYNQYLDIDDEAMLKETKRPRTANKLYQGPQGPTDNGYGINTLKLGRTTTTVRFAGTGGITKLGLLQPCWHTDVQVACPSSAIDASFTLRPTNYVSQATLRDVSYNWTGIAARTLGNKYMAGNFNFVATTASNVSERTVLPADVGLTADWFATKALTKVASNRKLTDLVVATNRAWVIGESGGKPYYPDNTSSSIGGEKLNADTNFSWCNLSGANLGGTGNYDKHPANLFNLKLSTDGLLTQAVVQVQCQQAESLRCLYVNLYQVGADIYASVDDNKSNWAQVTNAAMRADAQFGYDKLLGVDFDILHEMGESDRSRYQVTIDQAVARKVTDAGFDARNLHLVFKSYVITATEQSPIASTGWMSAHYYIRGCDDASMVLNITNLGGLPTNGLVKVQSGGELWLNGNWSLTEGITYGMSGGLCAMCAEDGGIIRQIGAYPFHPDHKILLDGGFIDFARSGKSTSGNQLQCCLYNISLANGAGLRCVDNRALRIGNGGDSFWSVFGSAPSTNGVISALHGTTTATPCNWTVSVAETGCGVDFVQNADILPYSDLGSSYATKTNVVLHKQGPGTMLLNACYRPTATFKVEAGTLLLGKSGIWTRSAPIVLSSGATLAAAEDTTNTTLGPLSVQSGTAKLDLAEGSAVTFADSTGSAWGGALAVTMATDSAGNVRASLRFKNGLTAAQKEAVTINGRKVRVDADGNVRPVMGLTLYFK